MIMCHEGENVDEEEKNTSEEVFCWSICHCKWFKYSPIFGNPTPHIRTMEPVTLWLLIFELGIQIGKRTPKLQTGGYWRSASLGRFRVDDSAVIQRTLRE